MRTVGLGANKKEDTAAKLQREIEELKKENKQLKAENKKLKGTVGTVGKVEPTA